MTLELPDMGRMIKWLNEVAGERPKDICNAAGISHVTYLKCKNAPDTVSPAVRMRVFNFYVERYKEIKEKLDLLESLK
jgi:hypothetical protein